jgi:Lrp/AsnC family transcriptional regulator, leucine-responsive regulatory protein
MDALDYKALSRLQQFGRDSWKRLGEILGITAQAAADRIHRLEEQGVVHGYAALIDPDAVGLHVTAFVTVRLERPRYRSGFIESVGSMSEVQECHRVAGEDDFLLKVRCRSTSDLERVVDDEIRSVPGVGHTRTTMVLRSPKETVALPLVTGPVQG